MSTAIEDEEPRDLIFFDTFSHDKDGVSAQLVENVIYNVYVPGKSRPGPVSSHQRKD